MSTERDLARLLGRIESRLSALEQGARTSQLQHASLTGTAITVYDEDGTTRRGTIGMQPDGTIGFVAEGGPPPGALSAPTVTPSLAGLRVVWDGLLADGTPLPADFAHAAVHVSTIDGFTPGPATFAGTITRAGEGGMLPVTPLPYEEHYVRLAGVNTSGVGGEPSAQASGTPVRVDGPDLTAGSVTAGTIAAGAVTADKLEAILTLTNRIVAGDPAGARVELNSAGLRVYDGTGALVVQFDAATGDAVFSGKVTGAEVTGGVVRTAASGRRAVLTPNGGPAGDRAAIQFYSSGTAEVRPGEISATVTDEYFVGPYLDIHAPVTDTETEGTSIRLHGADENGRGAINIRTSETTGIGFAQIIAQATGGNPAADPGSIRINLWDPEDPTDGVRAGASLGLFREGMTVSDLTGGYLNLWNGVVTSSNTARGRITITPLGDGKVTSGLVTGLGLAGSTFYGFATARTTVPGDRKPDGASGVTGVGVSGESSDGMTVYINRQNTIDTIVNWHIEGE